MRGRMWVAATLGFVIAYAILAQVTGFAGFMGTSINFFRVAVAMAVLILYVPAITTIFRTVPAPGRDYLLAGIMLSWGSSFGFAIWNEMGRIFHVDTSIFTSPIAGFFSIMLVIGGIFHLQAPYVGDYYKKTVALLCGIVAAILLVLIAPLFRTPPPPAPAATPKEYQNPPEVTPSQPPPPVRF